MTTIVLARKYRPRSFEEMVGQAHVVQALGNALTQRRLHHAYLFTGTRGVGKTTVSRIFAKSVNCVGPDGQGDVTAAPCGVCPACRDIDAGRFVDYVELDAASNRGVEEITQLLDQSVYKPVVGRFKVYMIDEVHMLSSHAFNAMLKTLEEPPEYLKFVLATTDPQKVPPTVLSRCLQFNLRPMAPQTVEEHLARVLAQEGIAAEPGALRLIARAARGSMRDGLSLADQAIAFASGSLQEAPVRQMLGAVDRGHVVRIVEALAASDGAALIGVVDALRGLGLSAAGTLEELAALAQQMAVLQAVPDAADAADPDAAQTARLASLLAADETQLVYSIAVHGRAELELAPDEYSGLVMVLLRLLAFRPTGAARRTEPRAANAAPSAATAAATSAAISRSEALRASAIVRATVPASREARRDAPPKDASPRETLRVAENEPPPWVDAPFDDAALSAPVKAIPAAAPLSVAAPPAVPTLVATPLGDRWAALVRAMAEAGRIGALVRELALQAQCLAVDEAASPPRWRLRVERETLRAAAQCDKLQAALAQTLGHPLVLEVEAGVADDSPALRDAAERARRQAEAEQVFQDDPLVQALLGRYKTARIVPGSIKPH